MITLERITKFNIQEKLAEVMPLEKMSKSFFGHYMTLGVFANLNGPELYLASNDAEKYIVVWKKMKREFRFLFQSPSQKFFDELMEQMDPLFVAANLLPGPSKREKHNSEKEIVLDTQKILNLENHDFRKEYHRAERKNPPFTILSYSYDRDIAGLIRFLEAWRHGRTEELNSIARVENDLNFLATFGDHPDTKGVIIRDGDKVIAYSIFAPYFADACVGLFGKILRGYESLGVVLTVEKCREMHKLGFHYAYLANMKNEFKKNLLWAGEEIETYSELWHENPGIKRGKLTTEDYLNIMTN